LEEGTEVEIAGINFAISNTIRLVEMLKSKLPGCVQTNVFETLSDSKVKFAVKLVYDSTNPENVRMK
jgi:hypothetical protein